MSERQIVDSVFNGWAVNKRLVFCPEIYEGHSFKAYNKLKTYITDKTIEVNEKFQRPYTVACWCHIIACSNDRKALRIEESDRRMFYPELTETPWPRPQWQAFYHWLEREGGLGIILRWALEFHEDESNGDYIYEGEQPPMTANKADLIERSKSPSRQEAEDIGAALAAERAPACITYSDLRSHIVETLKPKFAEDKKTLADWAAGKGAIRATTTLQKEGLREAGNVKIGGRMEYVLANGALMAALRSAGSEAAQNDLIRQHRIAVTGVAGALLVTDEPHAALFDETM